MFNMVVYYFLSKIEIKRFFLIQIDNDEIQFSSFVKMLKSINFITLIK